MWVGARASGCGMSGGRPAIGRRPPRRGGLGLAGLLETKLGDRCLAHFELLHLARDRHRELGGEPDVPRDLVVRDLALAVLPDLLSAQLLARAQPDPGAQFLAVLQVGDTNDLYVFNGRVRVKEFFDFARLNVLAAP